MQVVLSFLLRSPMFYLCVVFVCVFSRNVSFDWIAWMSQREQPGRVCKRGRQKVGASGESVCLDTDSLSVASGLSPLLFSGSSLGAVETVRVSPISESDVEFSSSVGSDSPASTMMGDDERPHIPIVCPS